MYKLLLLALFFAPLFSQAQTPRIDSARMLNDSMLSMQRRALNDLIKSPEYQQLESRFQANARYSDDYVSTNIMGEAAQVKVDDFNRNLRQAGFSTINNVLPRFGLSQTYKRNRFVADFTWFMADVNNSKARVNDRTVHYRSSSFVHFDFGYDLLRSPMINVYPYGGFRFNVNSLDYDEAGGPVNTGAPFLSGFAANTRGFNASRVQMGYQLGLAAEVVILQNKAKTRGIMFAVKGGLQEQFREDRYRYRGETLVAGIRSGGWNLQAGIKIFRRRSVVRIDED